MGQPCRILLMAALPQEVRPFLRQVKARGRPDLGLPACDWEGGSALLALSGMGGTAARRAGETLISRCRPQMLVSLGFGGALAPGLAAGDLILGETFWDYNPDTRELASGPQPPAPRPLPLLRQILESASLKTVLASVVTSTRIIHKGDQGKPLASLPQPVLDLETGILAKIAAAQALPFLSLRAITDKAAEEIPAFLREAVDQEVTAGVGAALMWLAGDLKRVRDLVQLWRRSRRAAGALAGALELLVPLLLAAGDDLEDQPTQEGEVNKYSHPA